jgi:hypothetical protein
LQMTVARKHPVVGQTIKDVIDLARNLNLRSRTATYIWSSSRTSCSPASRAVLDRR